MLAELSEDGRARLARFNTALAGAMSQRGRLTLRQWVRRAWLALGGPALIAETELGHVQTYFELLARHQAGMNLVDPQAFNAALAGQWAHAEARSDAVQLMTIHRAKGLALSGYPRFDNPYCRAERETGVYEIAHDGASLTLDFNQGQRTLS